MFSQLFEEVSIFVKAGEHIDREVAFSWGEADFWPGTFPSASVFVVVRAKADDAGSPHGGLFFCDILHQL